MCLLVAAAARVAGSVLQLGLETALALAFGLGLASIAAVREWTIEGAAFAARYALRIGITLLGARLTVGQLLTTGGSSVLAIVLIVSAALLLGTWLARRLVILPPLSALIAVGMAICGNSAILALAPIIGARHRDTAYAVSTITIFGLIGVLILPIVGHVLALTDEGFGTWAGLAVNDTAQVVATGYAFSPPAGDVATVVKLTRNLAILPVLLGATWWVARQGDRDPRDDVATSPIALVGRAIPWFVVGFVIVATLRSIGLLEGRLPAGGTIADLLSLLATLCILVALAGVGLATDIRAMLGVGARPFLLGALMWIVIGLLGLAVARVYHG
jgi:uncharacterized integral membrane protein (TIGR00698 family)